MQTTPESARTVPLFIDLAAGTVTVHGEEVELPLREFTLLAALARRVGEPLSSSELLKIIWAEDAEWTAPENLRILVTRLRRRIDGPTKFGQHIRNRRGFGYLLDLHPEEVVVTEGFKGHESVTAASDLQPADDLVALPGPTVPELVPTTASQRPVSSPDESVATHSSRGSRRLAAIAALVSALVAGSWSTGYLLSSSDDEPPVIAQEAEPQRREPSVATTHEDPASKPRRQQRRERARTRDAVRNRIHEPDSSMAMAAPHQSAVNSEADSANSQNTRQAPPESREKDASIAPALPPPPTRYLYHLVHPENGDHFVTTDPGTVSEQEAKGYQGGPIGRVYTYREDNTKAIQTNRGTAYIFVEAAAKTEPASRTAALWYSTNGAGDFFFTTSQSQAGQDGWTASHIGFVRTL